MGLRCASCGYDNDPTRVYCHSCGTRLERGPEAAPPPTGFMHPADVANMEKPRSRVPWGKYLGALVHLLVLSGLLGAVALALLPPVAVPPPVAADDNLARRLDDLVAASAGAGGARAFSIPAADINLWLVSSAVLREDSGRLGFRPERIYAVPGDGAVRVGVQTKSPFGWPVYLEGIFVPVRDGDGTGVEVRQYAVGRLPLPLFASPLVEHNFANLAEALADPLGHLARASHIGITPETVTLRWSGKQR